MQWEKAGEKKHGKRRNVRSWEREVTGMESEKGDGKGGEVREETWKAGKEKGEWDETGGGQAGDKNRVGERRGRERYEKRQNERREEVRLGNGREREGEVMQREERETRTEREEN